jgi:hypothetical protein
MTGVCLRCGDLFTLTSQEQSRCGKFYDLRNEEPPSVIQGMCGPCWEADPDEPTEPVPNIHVP